MLVADRKRVERIADEFDECPDLERITDREKDMIIRGGENIYCVEIEERLVQHDAIADAAVFKVPAYVELQHDKLPRNASAKLRKDVRRDEAVVSFEETM